MESLSDSLTNLTTDVNSLQTAVTTIIIPGIQNLENQVATMQQGQPTPAQVDALDATIQSMKTSLVASLNPPTQPPAPTQTTPPASS